MAINSRMDMIYTENITSGYNVTYNNNTDNGNTPEPTLPPTDPILPYVRFICEVGISLPIAILGIIGNILAFIVLCRERKQKLTTNVLLQALAVADTLVLISSILLRSLRYVGWISYLQVYSYIFVVLYPLVYYFRLADTWLTVMVTIDRYIAVCHPLHAQRLCTMKKTYRNIAIIVVSTLLFTLPRFFEYTLLPDGRFANAELTSIKLYQVIYRIIIFFLVMYLIPMMILIILNTRLLFTLRQAHIYRNSLISRGSIHNGGVASSSRVVTVIVLTVVMICIICNMGAMATHIVFSLQLSFEHLLYLDHHRRFLSNASNIMVTLNCAVNFIIYTSCSQRFRTDTVRIFKCQRTRRLSVSHGSKQQNDTSGNSNGTYISLGVLPIRVSFKNHKITVQHRASAGL